MTGSKWKDEELAQAAALDDQLKILRGEQEERLAEQRAAKLELAYINLLMYPIDPEHLRLLPQAEAEEVEVVVFYRQGKEIRLGAVDPRQARVQEIVERLKERWGGRPQIFVISKRSLKSAVARYAPEVKDQPRGREEMQVAAGESVKQDLKKINEQVAGLPPTEILTAIVRAAAALAASDIHVEPKEKAARLRLRIDGVLQDVAEIPRAAYELVLSRVKVLAALKLNVRDLPQDGSFVLRIDSEAYDMRVSVLPGGLGETLVIRLLRRAVEVRTVQELGMRARDYEVVQRELKRANGLVLVTGPTGSGKTTTLAACLQELNSPELKIITLEDPIEYRIAGITQTQVNVAAGYTFATGLRAALRQDPDIIMVGEMRDTETMQTGVHAALTGHLVLATLHTNNAPAAIPRLLSMKVKPFILAPALNVVVAQRLVRKVCRACAEAYTPDQKTRARVEEVLTGVVGVEGELRAAQLKFYRAVGCRECGETGYQGRVGVFEVLTIEDEIEELVLAGADETKLRRAAQKRGMTLIIQDAYLKVVEGITTLEEVARITEE
jgi:type II secretory ATPase GspE/PulE/Tfp pilus assembly ATPase PilB-like protein